jgi:hypothetical protein
MRQVTSNMFDRTCNKESAEVIDKNLQNANLSVKIVTRICNDEHD